MILGILIPLFLVIVVIVAARKLFVRDSHGVPSTFSVRRLFQYALLFGTLIISATGVAGLVGRLFDTGQVLVQNRTDLARDITFVIIGVPLYLLIRRWSNRTLADDPNEARSFAWNTYLTAISITALATSMTAGYSVINWVIGVEIYRGSDLARLFVWGLVWIFHWREIRKLAHEEEARTGYFIGSLIGLGTLSFGVGNLVASVARLAIESEKTALLSSGSNSISKSIALIIVGLPVWYQYWLRVGVALRREVIWYAYTLLIGVAGGFITLVVSASVMIFDLLVWYVGDTNQLTAERHFTSSAGALGSGTVGLLVWWYHANIVKHEAIIKNTAKSGEASKSHKSRDELRRVYEYIISGISLIAAAAGFMMILVAIIESITPGKVLSTTSSANTLLLAITLLLVGAPVWYFFWMRIESHLDLNKDEQSSPTRRIFLMSLFGVSSIAAVISVLTIVFIFLDDLLNSKLQSETLREMRYAIAILISNAALSLYHWSIYKGERDVEVRKPRRDKYIVLLGPKDQELANLIRTKFGAHVQMWRGLDGAVELSNWNREKVLSLIETSADDELLIVAEKRGAKLIPFARTI